MTRLLTALLLALAPLAVHAQDAEPMDEDGCLGTEYGALELCYRGTCYVGATIAVIAFLGRACQETAQPVPQAPPAPRQGVGLTPAPDAATDPDPLLPPAGPLRQPDDDS